MQLHHAITPLFSHKKFYHAHFLTIFYFILFNSWDWKLLFPILNLNLISIRCWSPTPSHNFYDLMCGKETW